MKINPHIFRGYDIRGLVGEDLNKETVEAIGKAYATFLKKRKIGQVVIGHDHRESGPEFKQVMLKALTSSGIDAIDIGLVMTQGMYFAQYLFQTNGGIMITASHNPKEFNGFKLAKGYSETMVTDELQEVRAIIEQDGFVTTNTKGHVAQKDITEEYINDIVKRVDDNCNLKIVIDTGNGAAGKFIPEALRRMGCEVIEQNTQIDSSFPSGTPDPIDNEMLSRVVEAVKKEKADLGLCFDGDGDRIGVVDEEGRVLLNDVLVAIFSKEILERFKGAKIVYNNLCSQIVKATIEQYGGEPIMWLTGHSFIKEKAAIEGAMFAGELSGHFFFIDNFYGHDDGCFAAARLVEYVASSGKTVGEIFDSLPKYVSSPEIKLACADEKKKEVIKQAGEKFKNDYKGAKISDDKDIPNNDGVRADFDDGMMIIRYSQNGPYITVKFEANDQETYNERKNYLRNLLEGFDDVKWDGSLGVNVDVLK